MEPDWLGETAVVIGNGNSVLGLGRAFFERLAATGWHTLIANSGFEFFPDAEVLMCSDRNWLPLHPDLSAFKGREIVVTRPEAVVRVDPRMRAIRRAFIEQVGPDLFSDPNVLVEGHNSTSTNISQAILRGAARILLLGIDLKPGPGGRRSAYNSEPDHVARAAVRYERQITHLTRQAESIRRYRPLVEVLNCSPRSGLDCYPYADMEALICSQS
jgi:hypothetical protein